MKGTIEIAKHQKPELVADCACEIGENPLWHPMEGLLYWTDIPKGHLFRYNPQTTSHELCYQGRPIGGFTIQSDGALLLFMDRGTIAIWRDDTLFEIINELAAERSSRFNDVIADSVGRVFCGTMSTDESRGRLYRLDLDGSIRLLLEDIGCSNGMAFSADQKTFYYTDSFAHKIYRFDYCIDDGAICNQRIFARFSEEDGLPDGATLDSEDRLWSALWNGGSVVRLLLDGTEELRIPLPTAKTSSLTFGGKDYSDLYITTAGGNGETRNGSPAGGLFRVRGLTPGRPEFFSRVEPPFNTGMWRASLTDIQRLLTEGK